MPAPKGPPPVGVITSIFHARITESHQAHLVAFLGRHGVLLASLNILFGRVIGFEDLSSDPNHGLKATSHQSTTEILRRH